MPVDRLLIRTRGSRRQGYGHIVRCMSLGEAARERGVDVIFAAQDPETQQILDGSRVQWSPGVEEVPRWVLRDLPGGSDAGEVRTEVAAGSHVMLLDDVGPARCEATLVGDAMMTPSRAQLLPHAESTEYLYGLEYTPLRKSIRRFCGCARPGGDRRLLIALGHGFDEGFLAACLRALAANEFSGTLELLLPQSAASPATLQSAVAKLDGRLLHGEDDIGPLLAGADLVVTKLGMTQLEAFAVGVGCLTLEPGEAHLEVQQALASHYNDWPAIELGLASGLSADDLARQILALLEEGPRLQALGRCAAALVDGRGAERLLDRLLGTDA